MFGNVTLEKAIAFTRISVALTCCWPPRFAATKSQIVCFKILRSAVMLNAFALLFPLLYALYVERDNPSNFVQAACLTLATLQVLVQTIFCISQYDRLRRLIEEMILYCEKAKSYESYVFQRCAQSYSAFYGVSAIWFYVSACTVVVGSVLISQPFPTKAEYPFAVDYEPLRTIIFLHQALVGMQCAAHACINMLGALLLLFAAARFEILMMELRNITDVHSLIEGVNKYHSVKRYAEEVVKCVKLIALNTLGLCGVALVLCGISFIGRVPLTIKLQFLCLGGTGLLEVFMCALPADRLMDVSQNAISGAYESPWYEETLRMQKNVLHMLMPQKEVAIRIKGIVPVLSLNYYCLYVSNVISLFTALRVTMMKHDDKS
ncbi:uncharacterized protein LOC128873437 isoform X2 [Hylaeus volcanicus]|uniref:uncharacterized protein LOC128873437 isoform X2 n=1 Tax=Hylaeus volcanicus TaxID=313075 RepID=UPI0023B84592|nr:uncharacterized protein LOC128873437 isoform X2 [Hylaeus volcanicus]